MKTCAWHECGRPFEPDDPRQRFCSTKCQRARASWKERRGAKLVDMLLNDDSDGLIAARDKIRKEIKGAIRSANDD